MKTSIRGLALVLAPLCAYTGCALNTPVQSSQTHQLAAVPSSQDSCCNGPAQFNYAELPLDQKTVVGLDRGQPVYAFTDGRSYFKAFSLPAQASGGELRITSDIQNGQVLAPSLLLLNAQHQVVQRLSGQRFLRYQQPNGFLGPRLTGNVKLPTDTTARYLVVYTSDADRAARTAYETAQRRYAELRGLAPNSAAPAPADHTATGQLNLRVVGADNSGGVLGQVLGLDAKQTVVSKDAKTAPQPSETTSAAPSATNKAVDQPLPTSSNGSSDDLPALPYRRMIRNALQAGDIELALQLAERARREGDTGVQAWLAQQLKTR